MPQPTILGLGTAVPAYCYHQMDICTALSPALNNRRAPAVFRATEIETRYSVLETPAWLVENPSNEARHNYYIATGPPLSIKAIQQALNQANLTVTDIDEFIVVSCTGVDCPGLDVLIADEMNMSPYLRRAAIVGMGCHALMNGLHQASTIVLARPQSKVLVLTVELCTLHFQHNRSIRNILGSALFADGAAAAVVGHAQNGGIRLLDSLSYSNYQTQKEISFHPGNNGYKIYLSTRIPDLLGELVPPLVKELLSRHSLEITDINHWIVHPGGMKILDNLEQTLALKNNALDHAKSILRDYGNMSSATLLFVLQRIVERDSPAPGEYGLLFGFGPGLTIELGLAQW